MIASIISDTTRPAIFDAVTATKVTSPTSSSPLLYPGGNDLSGSDSAASPPGGPLSARTRRSSRANGWLKLAHETDSHAGVEYRRIGWSPVIQNVSSGSYSMTSSARARIVGGTVKPSALAVLRLITNSKVVGCCIGNSAGFAPLRILPTYAPILAIGGGQARTIAEQASSDRKSPPLSDCRKTLRCRELYKLVDAAVEERIGLDDQGVGARPPQCCKDRVDFL
jgi:hypothetical protein